MYRVGIVGGETHIEEITRLHGSQLEIVGIAVDEHQTEWASEKFGVDVYTDYRRLFDEKSIDIVAIANVNDMRPDVMREALKRGKHVVVDKPMALRLSDVEELEKLAKQNNLRVLMLLTLRGSPWYRKVMEIVRAGTIGEPVHLYGKMSVPLKPEQRPPWFLDKIRSGGPIIDLAIHTIDQLEWVSGCKLTSVTAHEDNISHPEMTQLIDSGAELFTMNNGGTAVVEQDRVSLEYDYRLYVVGTKGQVDMLNNRSIRVQTEKGWQEVSQADLGSPQSVVEDWLASFQGGDALVPDEVSFRISKITCMAKEAAESGRRITLP